MNSPKNVNNKKWALKRIKKKIDISRWFLTKKIDFEQQQIEIFRVYLTLTEKLQKSFQCNFFDLGFTMKHFYQVPLTPEKTYQGLYKWKWCCDTHCFDLSCCFWRGQSKSECACDGKLKRSRLQTSKTWNMWTCLHESSNDKVRQNF